MAGSVATAAALLPESCAGGDPFGLRPRFQWTGPGGLIVRPSIEALLAAGADPALDYDALAVFLRLGFFVATIRHSPPSARSRRAGSRIRARRRRSHVARRPTHSSTPSGRRFGDAPSRAFHLPLSGGRDSRHILCALIDEGCMPQACVTVEHFPPRGQDDIASAAALCARLRVPHVVLPQRRDRTRAEREKNRRTHYCTDEHAQFVALADYLAATTPETYDGIAGDVLSQSTYLNPDSHRLFAQGQLRATAAYLLDGYGTMVSERALAQLLSAALLREVPRERAIARLCREIARHVDAPNPVASFFFWNRTRREVALSPFALMRDVHVHAPYLDDEVYTLLSAMPASLQMDRQLHTDAIRRAYPGVADIPYDSRTHRQQRPGFHRRMALELGRLLVGTGAGWLSPRLVPPTFATLVDGSAERLWFAPLAVYLTQLAAIAARAR